ncbi:orotidine-5'-phosphate decarboxylase [Liquorilactobacillus hordei]|uniref:Orotidine 5'-phosphate decarboxylase n=1 Tax=Liquorilactobacillus hordei DSM 19519 TaxID=1423759 RepID=A0A0R1MGC1_9LACO|nr:orotidine-5'-phosphate decarboxylase [Liquorilactobacillus hordei]KRL07086.1 orotidine 5-phosphate decarboxylase [Liquorilactobacillus hordei DSM 19519]QYH52148.1 orotidine-5'-phosphate decarboxylase [Liquorilactobacillus hordei DSM 19519]
MQIKRPIIALDFPSRNETMQFLSEFPKDESLFVKIGMELYYSEGPDIVREIKSLGHDVFLDLKCHDIPHTVENAMRVLGKLGIDLTTLHASGGSEMMTAAKSGILDGSNGNSVTKLLAITQLTSTNQRMVTEEQFVSTSLKESVLNYARLAKKVGMDGIVCSAQEAKSIVAETGESFLRVTPGIRLAGGAVGDQKRVMTPDEAARNQSSAIVVGRTITQAKDRVSAYQTVKKLWEDAK